MLRPRTPHPHPVPPRRRPDGWRRTAAGLAGVAALLAAGAAGPAPALSQPPGPPPGRPDAGAPVAPSPHRYELTLITGDRVELTVGAGGRYGVRVLQPAPRPADRPPVGFTTRIGPDGVYVLPSDAAAAIAGGRLDRELFNVSYLAAHGWAGAGAAELPVIVTFAEPAGAAARGRGADPAGLARRAGGLPAARDAVGLASVNGAAVTLDTTEVARLWRDLSGPATLDTTRPATIWLDRLATVALDTSVPLVGAPRAWQAGYDGTGVTVAVLDTGVDAAHPDLAGQVVAAESFLDGLPPADGNGHGTHVASTIAGTGAASGGAYTGVAPGARLLNGRVCDDAGFCPYSAMIQGMEWAAAQMRADIVSMSISGEPSDGTDPLSRAVDTLTAQTGALFVIAAGNAGGDQTVGSPGAADAALTVAATDDGDVLAGFSSRGPRFWDQAMKPDLAAPGVDIVAARAAGTEPGPPVGDHYTTLSGTSMATPHVSGAAAVLAQRYPDWSPEALKAALMSTAAPTGHTVYETGAGRLDLARAATQQVVATTAQLDFGVVETADEDPAPAPATRTVTYLNTGDRPVTLTLAATLAADGGAPTPPGTLRAPATVTVPAGGTATVDVVLDAADLPHGRYTGAVVATDDTTGIRVTTPVGLVRQPRTVTLTIHSLGPDGAHLDTDGAFILDVAGSAGQVTSVRTTGVGVTEARLLPGTYSVMQLARWVGDDSRFHAAWLLEPELTVEADTELVLDARHARPVSFATPEPSHPLSTTFDSFVTRTTATGETYALAYPGVAWTRLLATPTDEVTIGAFRFGSQWMLGAAAVEMQVRGPGGRALHPAAPSSYQVPGGWAHSVHPDYLPFDRRQDLRVVDAGRGTPQDLSGVDLTGALALVEVDRAAERFGEYCGFDLATLERVRDAGAAAVVAFPSADLDCPVPMVLSQAELFDPPRPIGVRHAYLPTAEGRWLRERLASGPVTVRVSGTPLTPYVNVLRPVEDGRVPPSLHYRLTDDELARFDLDYHAARPDDPIFELRYVWRADDVVISPGSVSAVGPAAVGPTSRREYVGPVGPDVYHLRDLWSGDGLAEPDDRQRVGDLLDRPVRTHQRWFAVPLTPGAAVASPAAYENVEPGEVPPWARVREVDCALCREGDLLVGLAYLTAGAPDDLEHDVLRASFQTSYRLYRDGVEIPAEPLMWFPGFRLPSDTGTYRLEMQAPGTEAVWTFTSGPPREAARQSGYRCLGRDILGLHDDPCAPVPAVFVSYDLGASLALDNTVRAPGAHRFTVHAYHHPGPDPAPAIARLRLWVSYGDGQWTPVAVRDLGGGSYEATVVHPPARHRFSDRVSLRVEAVDVDGNRIEQTTRDAFRLADPGNGPH